MVTLTYTTKLIFDSKEEFNKILEVLAGEQKAFNEASEVWYQLMKSGPYNIVILHKLFYKEFRKNNPEIPAQIVIRAQNACISAYQSIKSSKHKIEGPAKKKKLSLQLDKRLYSYKGQDKLFKITTFGKRISVKFILYKKLEKYLDLYKFGDPKIFEKNGNIYISFPFKIESTTDSSGNSAIGIDLGIRRFFATSDGQIFQDKHFNKRKRQLRYLKRQLQSKGTKSAKRHLGKIREKESNINKNFSHHLANKILKVAKNSSVIVVEDLNLIKLKKKKHPYQNKNRISQVGFAQLVNFLSYKAELVGKRVVKVNPAYTSQTDPVTGKREGVRKGCRFYSTSGIVYDADCSAAINIARLSELPFSCVFTLDGQAVVNRPIV